MKSSLNKLKRIALHKSVSKEKKEFQPSVKFDELALAAKVLPLLSLSLKPVDVTICDWIIDLA